MPRTRSLAWSELKIGVLTIVAVVIAVADHLHADRRPRVLLAALHPEDAFANVAGLKSGSPVRVAGVEVGTVTSVDDFVGEQVDVTFEVNESMRERITTRLDRHAGSVSLWARARWTSRRPRGHADSRVGLRHAGARRRGRWPTSRQQASAERGRDHQLVTDIRTGKARSAS